MWDSLDLDRKRKWIQFFVRNGITDRQRMKSEYDAMYLKKMEDVAQQNYANWGYDSPEKALVHALNDNTYDYNKWFADNPGSTENSDTHWRDDYKTVYHPTFSDESMYSGVVDRNYNPEGRVGGHWGEDGFVPADWQYREGGSIEIKHPGRLTELKKRTGKTEAELWATGNKDYRRMINFARQARKWHKNDDGGHLFQGTKDSTIQTPKLTFQGGKPYLTNDVGTFLPQVSIQPEQPERPGWFARQSMNAAMADNAPFMQAVGWEQDRNGDYHQDPTTQGAMELSKALFEIGLNGATDVFLGPVLEKAVESGIKGVKAYRTAKAANAAQKTGRGVSLVPESAASEIRPGRVVLDDMDDVMQRLDELEMTGEPIPQEELQRMRSMFEDFDQNIYTPEQNLMRDLQDIQYNTDLNAERIVHELNQAQDISRKQAIMNDIAGYLKPASKIEDLSGNTHRIYREPLRFARRAEGDINHALYFNLSPDEALGRIGEDFAQLPSKGRAELIGHDALSTDSYPFFALQAARKHGNEGTLKAVRRFGKPVYQKLNDMGRNVLKGKRYTSAEQLERLNKAIDKVNKTTGLDIPHGFIEKTDFNDPSSIFENIYMPALSFSKFGYGGHIFDGPDESQAVTVPLSYNEKPVGQVLGSLTRRTENVPLIGSINRFINDKAMEEYDSMGYGKSYKPYAIDVFDSMQNVVPRDLAQNQMGNGGGIIWDNMGQWNNPGKVTGITGTDDGTDITMKGVADYLYGIDNYGNGEILVPGQDYHFPGDKVVEYPITSHKHQFGGLLGESDFGNMAALAQLQGARAGLPMDFDVVAPFLTQGNVQQSYYPYKTEYVPRIGKESEKKDYGKFKRDKKKFVEESFDNWYDTFAGHGHSHDDSVRMAKFFALQDAYESGYGNKMSVENNNFGGMNDVNEARRQGVHFVPVKYNTKKDYYEAKYNDIVRKWNGALLPETVTIEDFYNALHANPAYQYAPKDVNPNYLNSLLGMKSAQKWIDEYSANYGRGFQEGGLAKPFSYKQLPVVRFDKGGHAYIEK